MKTYDITYKGKTYKSKTLKEYKVRHVNHKTDKQIIDLWRLIIVQYFDRNDLEDEVVIKLGRIIDEETRQIHRIDILPITKENFEKLDKLMVGTVVGERLSCYYKVFEPLKFRQMKIDRIKCKIN